MDHKISVKQYLPKIRHHCKVAKRHELAVRRVKSDKKRRRHVNKARRHRRICAILAHIWTAQCAWNRQHWDFVMDKMYGPLPDVPIMIERTNYYVVTCWRDGRLISETKFADPEESLQFFHSAMLDPEYSRVDRCYIEIEHWESA